MPSKSTSVIGLRIKNEDIDALDAMCELIGKNRSETVRILLTPSLIQAKVAMETKSVVKAASARLNAEMAQSTLIRELAKKSEIQDTLNLAEYSFEAQMI